ncbi:hypothetical protein CUMW_066170 [Citrus unshiu]|nr:hypothetical protein CUMW_066170 [Citrus unshiu]
MIRHHSRAWEVTADTIGLTEEDPRTRINPRTLLISSLDFVTMLRHMRYEMRFPHLSVVAPGHDGSLITRPSRSGYDEIIPLGDLQVHQSTQQR